MRFTLVLALWGHPRWAGLDLIGHISTHCLHPYPSPRSVWICINKPHGQVSGHPVFQASVQALPPLISTWALFVPVGVQGHVEQ